MVRRPGEFAVDEVNGAKEQGLNEGEEFALLSGVVAHAFGKGQGRETDKVLRCSI